LERTGENTEAKEPQETTGSFRVKNELMSLHEEVLNVNVNYLGQEGRGGARGVRMEVLKMIDRRLGVDHHHTYRLPTEGPF
jgi:hypothetical protein